MPQAAGICSLPGCPNDATRGGRCDQHRHQDRTRRARSAPYERSRWRRIRAAFLDAHPTCLDCGGRATEADHAPLSRKQLVARSITDPDDPKWLQPRCKPCHSRRTNRKGEGGHP